MVIIGQSYPQSEQGIPELTEKESAADDGNQSIGMKDKVRQLPLP